MSTKTHAYLSQSLAATGFALLDSQMAYLLRPDLWATGQDCAMDFRPEKILTIQRVTRMTATIEGRRIPVLVRSTVNLAERIEEITGCKVQCIEVEKAPAEKPAVEENPDIFQRREAERLDKIRQKAAEELPSHDCHDRKEILAARAELERMAA